MNDYDTETIDRLFLELSQFTTASTTREIGLRDALREALNERNAILKERAELEDYLWPGKDGLPKKHRDVVLAVKTRDELSAPAIAQRDGLKAALESVPVHRLDETPEQFIARFKAWYREIRNPALSIKEAP